MRDRQRAVAAYTDDAVQTQFFDVAHNFGAAIQRLRYAVDIARAHKAFDRRHVCFYIARP